jgi:hypothetical protein
MDLTNLRTQIAIELGLQYAAAMDSMEMSELFQPADGDTEVLRYGGLGDVFYPREQGAPAVAATPIEYGVTIQTRKWFNPVKVDRHDIEFGVLGGQLKNRLVAATQAMADWAGDRVLTRLSEMESTACYDGQFFFDTDHPGTDEAGIAFTTDNDKAFDVADNATTILTEAEAITLIRTSVGNLSNLRSNTGRYGRMYAGARDLFIIASPDNGEILDRVTAPGAMLYNNGSGAQSPYANAGLKIVRHARIPNNKVYFFKRNAPMIGKPFIRQTFGPMTVDVSQLDVMNNCYYVVPRWYLEVHAGEFTSGLLQTLS